MKVQYPKSHVFLHDCAPGDCVLYEGQAWVVGLKRMMRLSDGRYMDGANVGGLTPVRARVVVDD